MGTAMIARAPFSAKHLLVAWAHAAGLCLLMPAATVKAKEPSGVAHMSLVST